jgi:hypothetical protein
MFVAIFVLIFLVSVGCWIMVFSKRARAKMPMASVGRSWLGKPQANRTEDERELEDGMSLIAYLLGAMVSTLLWVSALVIFVFRYR